MTIASEKWLNDGNHDHFGQAMALCQNASGTCASAGVCLWDGDCFRPSTRGYLAAKRKLDALIEAEPDQMVRVWLADARNHMERVRSLEGGL